ncbi:PsbP domain-containing protein 7, chloroplastic [Tanacetum coccineum]
MTQQNPKDNLPETNKSPAEQFLPLAATFRRRLLTGIGSASLVAVGANFAGTTSFLLGLSPETARNLKLDVIYPIKGYSRIEAFGGPEEVGEAIVRKITGRRPDVIGTLIKSNLREDEAKKVKYYVLEFAVESPSFRRHNVAVCCAHGGRLFTLNAQTPESTWPELKSSFYTIADSFSLTS